MGKRKQSITLIPIVEYAENSINERTNKPFTVQGIYKQIKIHQKGKKIPFRYVKLGKIYWIVKE